jgi:starch phosphorylase
VLLLDTDFAENRAEDREITHYLYGGDDASRLTQEIVLGIGGARMLQALGFEISRFHMNEGHSALLGLELLRRFAPSPERVLAGEPPHDVPRVREHCCFTTHTPIEAAHDRFPYDLVRRLLGSVIDFDGGARSADKDLLVDVATLRSLAGHEQLNMTQLALNLSEYVNGVAKRHAELAAKMYPGYRVHAITNGVHPATWASASFRALYDRYLPGWSHEPELLARVDCCVPDELIVEAHSPNKRRLIERVRALSGVELQGAAPIIGYARRMTAYKRPDLLFSEPDRLLAIARRYPFQVVLAGKAHPRDEAGKRVIEELHARLRGLGAALRAVFLPDYDLGLAQTLIAGADLWLNTPLPPLEASGTSGMKAALNGVPSLSVLDGWWIEGCIEGVTGWAIGTGSGDATAASLYDKLERVILPLYYGTAPSGTNWTAVMKGAIARNGAYFNSHRMMRRYATEAYRR